jgi:ribosome maturation factor RimP
MSTTITDRVVAIVEPIVAAASLTVYDVDHAGGTLRVFVDGPDGVTLAQLDELTRTISVALDVADPIPGHYTLEVSSPGLERSLRRADHFAGAVGEMVSVRTVPGPDGRQRVRGVLTGATADTITIDVDEGPLELALGDVERATVVFEWGPGPKPGGPKHGPGRGGGRHQAASEQAGAKGQGA